MDSFVHVGGSPAVRARHLKKRLPVPQLEGEGFSAPFGNDGPTVTITESNPAFLPLHTSTSAAVVATQPNLVSTTSSTPTPTTSSTPTSAEAVSTVTTTTYTTATTSSPSRSSSISVAFTVQPAPATTPSSADTNSGNSDAASSKGISGGAVGAIVTIFLLALLAVGVFVVRKKYLRNRQLKRATWNAGAFAKHPTLPPLVEKTNDNTSGVLPTTVAGNRTSSFSAYGGVASGEQRLPSPSAFGQVPSPYNLPPPPMTYNNFEPPTTAHPPALSPGMGAAAAVSMTRATTATPKEALIKCTFIPSLPDELSITTGETVRVVAEYDDGWVMCLNMRGEQGMVPVECLDYGDAAAGSGGHSGSGTDWRNSKRTSSLSPAWY